MLANVPTPGRDFGGLVRYLTQGKYGAKANPERVLWATTRNLMTENPLIASKIMTATARRSVRTERPVYHAIISWAEAEQPSFDDMNDVVTRTLDEMGLNEHQALIVAHGDTTNPHVHMLINRVHAETGVAWETSFDYLRLEQSIRQQAKEMGFIAVPGRHVADGQKRERHRAPTQKALKQSAASKSMQPWPGTRTKALADKLQSTFKDATSWDELAAALQRDGLDLEAKGKGVILTDGARSGYAKLSSLGSSVRAKALAASFGESFQDYAARAATQKREMAQGSVFSVTEMDVAVGLYRMGLADRDDVKAAAANRTAKLEAAPLHTRETRALRATLSRVIAPVPKASPPKAPERKDQEPEPQR